MTYTLTSTLSSKTTLPQKKTNKKALKRSLNPVKACYRVKQKPTSKRPYVAQFGTQEWGLSRSAKIDRPCVLFHGGLGDQLADRPEILSSLSRISKHVQKFLQKDALDLALTAVQELESDPVFNAGLGARLQSDGQIRLSSAVMDGFTQRMASVSNILGQKHPSKIAQRLLGERDRNLSSVEATQWALKQGFLPTDVRTPHRVEEFIQRKEGKSGTVGAVAIDRLGRTAASTSTGGRGYETPGRVSDSFTPAGNFASPFGAVSCTGTGEEILEAAVASSVLTRLEDGIPLSEAVARTFARHREKTFGMIGIDAKGQAIVYATRGALCFGLITPSKIFTGLLPQDWADVSLRNS